LTGALGILLQTAEDIDSALEQELLHELIELNQKITVAIALHVETVNRTQLIRSKIFIRFFRLAGKAPLPVTYEFEADVI
jgi:hypothetical protein